jgi:hypothetical protein
MVKCLIIKLILHVAELNLYDVKKYPIIKLIFNVKLSLILSILKNRNNMDQIFNTQTNRKNKKFLCIFILVIFNLSCFSLKL